MDKNRHIQRQPVTVHRDCNMGVITFDHLDWTDYNASILDISMNGVGIESNSRTEPGFVWFRNPIWGQQSGVLLWSKQVGTRYRSGIRFASLPSDAEAFVKNHLESSMPHQPLKDLEKIVKIMIEHIKEDSGSGRGMIMRRSENKTKNCRLDNKQ
jgi:hypothetical protein